MEVNAKNTDFFKGYKFVLYNFLLVNLQEQLIFAGWFCFEYDAEAARKETATNVQPRPVAADADVATQVPAAR